MVREARPAVLITGGARRIGAVLARTFDAAGWHVVVHVRHSDAASAAFVESLPHAELVECDLSDGDAAAAMVSDLAARLGDWRALVNCAAVFEYDDAAALLPEVWAEAITVNAAAPVRLAQAFLEQAQAAGGKRVINFLDQKLANPNPDFFSYTMAKQALAAATRMLAMGAGDTQTRVYGLAPGAMLPSFDQQTHEHEASGRMNLLGRLTDPLELAEAALWLCEGWLASGETLFIDSGQHLLAQSRDVLFLARGE